jgi:tetratricopeptide (TPR) repeat protein
MTRKFGRLPGYVVASVATIALLLFWSTLFIEQNAVWRDRVSLSRRSVEVDPRSAYARSGLAATYFAVGNLREAEDEARTAIRLDPNCVDAQLNLSYILEASGRIDQAIKNLETAKSSVREGAPNGLGRIHRTLGRLYQRRNDLGRAEENFRSSVDVVPYPYAPNSILLGDFYFDQGRYDEARQVLEDVLPFVPAKYSLIHLKLGQVFDRLHQPDRARAEYEKYLALIPPTAKDRSEVERRLSQL